MLTKKTFGPANEFNYLVSKTQDGKPFFIVPTPSALAFEWHMNNSLKSKGGRVTEIKVNFPSDKNNFYEISVD